VPASQVTFPLVPRGRIVGLAFGGMVSVRRGSGSDVAGSRPYRPGDNIDRIDWAASARLSIATGNDEFVVREYYAEEAPRAVILCDRRPAMSVFSPDWPWLSKPTALLAASRLISASTLAARGLVGTFDHDGDREYWHPPRTQGELGALDLDRPFRAREDTLDRGLTYLGQQRRDLPSGTFLFVVSDFIVDAPRDSWFHAVEHGWDIVPVIVQDPVWERSFPDVGGVVVPFADPRTGRTVPIGVSTREAARLREHNEQRFDELVRGFRALDLDPVLVDSDDAAGISAAFLDWADRRSFARGAAR
jgi:uncharacterized protein (DUF58 family)